MNTTTLIQQIANPNVDVDFFVQLAIMDRNTRDEIIQEMLANPDIMVYYHCYYVVSKGSQERPDLFYLYWGEMASLLKHPNSYHRDIALTVLANLTQVDVEDRFSSVYQDYFEHLHDVKFMTAKCCLQNSKKILKNKPELRNQILALLLDLDHQCPYPEKQKELMKFDVLEILEEIRAEISDPEGIDSFIRKSTTSISPKTKKKAKELAGKFGL